MTYNFNTSRKKHYFKQTMYNESLENEARGVKIEDEERPATQGEETEVNSEVDWFVLIRIIND